MPKIREVMLLTAYAENSDIMDNCSRKFIKQAGNNPRDRR